MPETPLLGLPILEAAQAQKHVTHNEALLLLDAAIHLSVISRVTAIPPVAPLDGDRYLVASGAAGAWVAQAGKLAIRQNGGWLFTTPRKGWRMWIEDEEKFLVFDGLLWRDLAVPDELANLDLVGVNASADAANRLTVSSPAVLFTHAGADHRLKINKQAAANTASLLYQSGYSGRAEVGLSGDDDFHVKVSADGATWNEAIVVDRATGAVSFPNTASVIPEGVSMLLARHDLLNAAWNGTFELGDAGWLRQTGWTIQNDPANARSGNWVAACSSVTGVATDLRTLNQNRVRAGETVYAECWVKSSAGAAFTTLQIMTRWLDKDLAAITSSSGTNFNSPQTSYVISNVTAVAPANAAYYVVNVGAAQTSGTIWVDDAFSFRRRDAASLLANASITSAQLGDDITAAGKALLIADDAAAQTAQLSNFTAALKGLVPASGGGAINFLRADGTWSAPPAGGGGYHAVATLAADVATAANTTPVSVTGLSFSFEANAVYFFRWIGATSAAATTTGSGFQIDVDVAVIDIRMSFFHQMTTAGTITGGSSQADDLSFGVSTGNPLAGGEVPITGQGMLRSGADAGTAQLRLRSEAAAVVTARAGMTLVVERVT